MRNIYFCVVRYKNERKKNKEAHFEGLSFPKSKKDLVRILKHLSLSKSVLSYTEETICNYINFCPFTLYKDNASLKETRH